MKKNQFSLLALAVLIAVSGNAQNVGINADGSLPNPNAILDVKSFNKGVLIPRVSTTGRLAIPNTKGLLVYDTTANSFWYNNGSSWQNMAAGATGGGWSLTGNNVSDTNFIGTTNDKPLIIKLKNLPAGRFETDLTNNIFLGLRSGSTNTGNQNTAIGNFSMWFNTTGHNNAALGFSALSSNTTGINNTAIGISSLNSNNTGIENTATGAFALDLNTSGGANSAYGANSLLNNRTGSNNTAAGEFSLYNNDGTGNTATGYTSLLNNTIGEHNTAVGSTSMNNNSTGSFNAAVGYQSMFSNVTGSYNAAVGNFTLGNCLNGTVNTGIGSFADAADNTINATAIGFGAFVNTSNKVRIGNSTVTSIEGQVPFTTPSDGRFKYQVKEDVKGLDFILQLRPVTYQFDVKGFDAHERQGQKNSKAAPVNNFITAAFDEASAIRRSGFIAQEVEKAADASGYNFSGIIKPKTEQEHYSLSYESFVVPLVKAIQEQQKLILELQKQIAELKKQPVSK